MAEDIFEPADFSGISLMLPDGNEPMSALSFADNEFSSHPDWISYVADMIIAAAQTGERVLVLTLSCRDTQLITHTVQTRRPDKTPLLIQHTEPDPIPSRNYWIGLRRQKAQSCYHQPAGKALTCPVLLRT